MTQRWRELTGPIPDAVELSFSAAAFTTGEAINFELTGRDVDELRRFAATLRGSSPAITGCTTSPTPSALESRKSS